MERYYEELKEYLEYNPDTGIISWIKYPRRGISLGPAGGLDKDGYIIIGFRGVSYKAHRLAYYLKEGYVPENDIDHVDGDTGNNKWINLREVSRSCNNLNMGTRKSNKTGLKGVFFVESRNVWGVSLSYCGIKKKTTRSSFDEAVKLRYKWEQEYCTDVCREKSPAYLYLKDHGLLLC